MESNWIENFKDAGVIRQGKNPVITFESKTVLDIKSMTSSCGCTTPTYDPKTKLLTVKYKPGKIPHHLTSMNAQQYVSIVLKEGSNETVGFKIKVVK